MNNTIWSLDIKDDNIGLASAGLNIDIFSLGHGDLLTASCLNIGAAIGNIFGCQGWASNYVSQEDGCQGFLVSQDTLEGFSGDLEK